jgi:Helix-turn-helix domain
LRIDDYKFRFIDQPGGWLRDKTKPDVPYITNLRLDPFERTGWPDSGTKVGAQQYFDWFKYEFWRFVFVQQEVEKLAMTAIEFPPMQKGASFNLDAVKAKIASAQAAIARDEKLPGAAIRTAVLLCEHQNADLGCAWPSLTYIAVKLKMHKSTVIRSLRVLGRRGWIAITSRRGRHRTNQYCISFGTMDDEDSDDAAGKS